MTPKTGKTTLALAAAAVVLALPLTACANRQDSIAAAMALAEANYPGELQLHNAALRSDHYEVVLVRPDDPYTWVRFNIDRDPERCRPGTPCEDRLRRAYDAGIVAGRKLMALDRGFQACDVPAVALYDNAVSPALRTVVELDLPPADPQPSLDRLAPCIAAVRSALPEGADDVMRAVNLVIVRPQGGGRAGPLTFDNRPSSRALDQPSYMLEIPADQDRAVRTMLRLNPHFPVRGLNAALSDAARRVLRQQGDSAHVPQVSFPRITLDADRLDVVHAEIEACSDRTPGVGPCRTDVTVRLRYDMSSGEASDAVIVRGDQPGR